MSVTDIIKEKMKRNGLAEGNDFELRLRGSYGKREFTVQYQETDHAFISRLCEHLGIFYFFDHTGEAEKVIFGDDKSAFPDVDGEASVPFYPQNVESFSGLRCYALESTTRRIAGKYIVRDYNYRTPAVDLLGASPIEEGTETTEIVEYGTHFRTPDEGKRLARLRAEEILCTRLVFQGRSNAVHLQSGNTFTLEGHPRGDLELLITEVWHKTRQSLPGVIEFGDGDDGGYNNEYLAIQKNLQFRPPRVTPKPRVNGVVTGVIDAAARGQYAEIDGDGRYKVRFLYDTTNPGEGQASGPVRMAQPHSGAGYGMHFPLRPGIEVILTCIDGDPDRPIIAGTVPNPSTASPVTGSNAERNVIRTGGGNEMNFDDTEGSQRLKISIPHSDTVFQLGAPNGPEQGAYLGTISNATNVVGQGVSTFSKINSTVALVTGWFAEKNITNWAGKKKDSDILDKINKGTELIESIEKVVEAGKGTWEAVAKTRESFAKEKAANKADATKEKREEALAAQHRHKANGTTQDDQIKKHDDAWAEYEKAHNEAHAKELEYKDADKEAKEAQEKAEKAKADREAAEADLAQKEAHYNSLLNQFDKVNYQPIVGEARSRKQSAAADEAEKKKKADAKAETAEQKKTEWEEAKKKEDEAKKKVDETEAGSSQEVKDLGNARRDEMAANDNVANVKHSNEEVEKAASEAVGGETGAAIFKGIHTANEAAKTVMEGIKAGKEIVEQAQQTKKLISEGAKALNEELALDANKKAAKVIAMGKGTQAAGRTKAGIPLIASPYCLSGSDNSSAVIGKKLALFGSDKLAVLAAQTVGVAGSKTLMLHSANKAEFAGNQLAQITTSRKLDILVKSGTMYTKVASHTTLKVGGNYSEKIEKNYYSKIDQNASLIVKEHYRVKVKQHTVKVAELHKENAKEYKLLVDTKITTKSETLKMTIANTWKIEAKSSMLSLSASGVGFKAESGKARLYKGGNHVQATASDVTISGGSMVKIQATTIKANGKCLLG